MQINQNLRTLEIGGGEPAALHSAQILATPQMFKVLYDQVYTKKEEAVVRELLCNAWDAHVVQGTTHRPIEVHLPTVLEPWFEIKDYGTGLSPEDVISLYMNYGASNKTHTNSLIGGFGLGSKTPFAYTDQFSVQTRWHGREFNFQAMLQENGTPACIEAGNQPTTEPNGLTVYVPTRASTMNNAFSEPLAKLMSYIPVAPKTNIPVEPSTKSEPLATYDFDVAGGLERVEMRHFHSSYRFDEGTVVMGLVPYTVSYEEMDRLVDQVKNKLPPNGLRRFIHTRAKHYSLTFFAPIGACTVTVSREALSLDDRTRDNLRRYIEIAYTALYEELTENLKTAPNAYTWVQATKGLGVGRSTPTLLGNYVDHRQWVTLRDDRAELNWEAILQGPMNGAKPLTFHHRAKVRRYRVSEYSVLGNSGPKLPATIYVAPDRKHIISRFAEQYFNNSNGSYYNTDIQPIICVHGEIQDIRDRVAEVGLPVPVLPMPMVAAPPRSTGAQKLGATEYTIQTFNLAKNLNSRNDTNRTANNFLDMLNEDDYPVEETLFSLTPSINWAHFRNAQNAENHRLIRPIEGLGYKHLIHIYINDSHTRVRSVLEKELESMGYMTTNTPIEDLFEANETRIRRINTLAFVCDPEKTKDTPTSEWFEERSRRKTFERLHPYAQAHSPLSKLCSLLKRVIKHRWDIPQKTHDALDALSELRRTSPALAPSTRLNERGIRLVVSRRLQRMRRLRTAVASILPEFGQMPSQGHHYDDHSHWSMQLLATAYNTLYTQKKDAP